MGVIRKILEVFGLAVIVPLLVAFYLSGGASGLALTTRNLVVLITSFIAVLGVIVFLKLGRILTQLYNNLQVMAKGGMVYQQEIKKSSGASELANSINEVSQRLRESMDELEGRAILIERANQEMGRMNELQIVYTADIVHELRAPLINIDKSSAILLEQEANFINAEQGNFLRAINENAKRLILLTNNLLDISKMEAGRLSMRLARLSVKNIIDEAVRSIEGWGQSKILVFETRVSEGAGEVYADKDRIIQVIVNLLSNAIKFSYPKGKILIEAKVFKEQAEAAPPPKDSEEFIEVSVQDKGIGIPNGQKEIIFDRFKTLSNAHFKTLPGTGLGLPIAKQIVEMHGGKIWLVSYPGKGSKFSFIIPKGLGGKLKTVTSSMPQLSKRILIIDDEDDIRELLSRELNKKGYSVSLAKDGLEGLKKAIDYYYDLVITDVRMPKVDGVDCIKILRTLNPKLLFIIITGFAIEEDLEKVLKAEAYPCIKKPFDLNELLKTVKESLVLAADK